MQRNKSKREVERQDLSDKQELLHKNKARRPRHIASYTKAEHEQVKETWSKSAMNDKCRHPIETSEILWGSKARDRPSHHVK